MKDKMPPTAKPRMRKGMESSQMKGSNSKSKMATGQATTSNKHHSRTDVTNPIAAPNIRLVLETRHETKGLRSESDEVMR